MEGRFKRQLMDLLVKEHPFEQQPSQTYIDRKYKPWNIVSIDRYILSTQELLEFFYVELERSQLGSWTHHFCR